MLFILEKDNGIGLKCSKRRNLWLVTHGFLKMQKALNEDCTDEEFDNNDVDDFHDIFIYKRRNDDGTYPDIRLLSKEQTLQFLIDEDQYIEYQRPKHKILNTIYAFWEHYPDGLIEFG